MVADLNGDTKLDLAVANFYSYTVTILLGDGAGGFTQAAGSPVAVGMQPLAIAVGNFTSDGKPDLVVVNYYSSNVTILLGNGLGGFSQAPGSPIAVPANPVAVAVGNWDGYSFLDDLAVVASDKVTILLGFGNGTFTQAAGSPVTVGTQTISIAAGDVNGDGKLDLATANEARQRHDPAGNGLGGFSPAPGSPTAAGNVPAPSPSGT